MNSVSTSGFDAYSPSSSFSQAVGFVLVELDAIREDCFLLPAAEPRVYLAKLAPRCFGACAALASPCPSPQLLLLLSLCWRWFHSSP